MGAAPRSRLAISGTGVEKEYAATALTYEPNYNEYREAPTTVYEHTVLANRFEEADGTDLLLSNQTFTDGRDITLVTLDGSLSATGSDAARSIPAR